MNIKKLLDTIRLETEPLYWYLIEELKTLGMTPEFGFDDWIYVDNDSPIMLVAHMDTITRNAKLKFRVKHNRITARNSVLGADDRAGVYAIMELLQMCKDNKIPMPSVLFTNYEESGMQGVDAFIKTKKMEKNMNIFIELDRRGRDEYVYYFHGMPKEVATWVESFGFKKDHGSMSDVMSLTEEYSIPHVNLSVGYYDQHTSREMLRPNELQETIDKVFAMICDPLEELHVVDGSAWNMYNYGYGDYGDYGGSYYPRKGNGWTNTYNGSFRKNLDYDYEIMKHNSKKIIPKEYRYNVYLDELEEIEYVPDASDIPWEDDVIDGEILEYSPDDDYPDPKYISIHGMTDSEYSDEYYNEY